MFGNTDRTSLDAGKNLMILAKAEVPEECPDGNYIGKFVFSVKGNKVNTDLQSLTGKISVIDKVYSLNENYEITHYNIGMNVKEEGYR